MIGIVMVAHGGLASEFELIAEHILGPQENLRSVCIASEDDTEEKRDEILQAIQSVECGNGVIVLTDMFGGTPSNLAISLMEHARIEIIAGFNLPLLVKLLSIRKGKKLSESVEEAVAAGKNYIYVATQVLSPPEKTTDVKHEPPQDHD